MNHFPTRAEIAAMRNAGMAKPLTEPKIETVSPLTLVTECPKCGRKLGRGKHAHLKSCKGK